MSDERQPPKTRTSALTEKLQQAILKGELAPGERLRQVDVAQFYGVSTTPVREAFAALAREGLVHRDNHRSVRVTAPTAATVGETYGIRRVLEPRATTLAAPRLTPGQLEELAVLIEKMRSVDPSGFVELNEQFHRSIYVAAGRPRLVELIVGLQKEATGLVKIAVLASDPAQLATANREHEEIFDALRARDPGLAGRLMRTHLLHSERHIAATVRAAGLP